MKSVIRDEPNYTHHKIWHHTIVYQKILHLVRFYAINNHWNNATEL